MISSSSPNSVADKAWNLLAYMPFELMVENCEVRRMLTGLGVTKELI